MCGATHREFESLRLRPKKQVSEVCEGIPLRGAARGFWSIGIRQLEIASNSIEPFRVAFSAFQADTECVFPSNAMPPATHHNWFSDTGTELTTTTGQTVKVIDFNHIEDEQMMSASAKHFRNQYIQDEQIDEARTPMGLSEVIT